MTYPAVSTSLLVICALLFACASPEKPAPKKPNAYEGPIRPPLLVRGPGVPAGEKSRELVANVDLAPTIADWAAANPPENPDGRSLAPLLSTSPSNSWREALLIKDPYEIVTSTREQTPRF